MATKVAVIGSSGQLGQDLVFEFKNNNFDVFELSHQEIEVTDIESVSSSLKSISPNLVINTAAYHNVLLCESDPEMAYSVNVEGSFNVAQIAKEVGAKNVYISTDYVFDGELPKGEFNKTSDSPSPLNVYGVTKFLAEERVLEVDPNSLIFRVSSVFGKAGSSGKGGNFIEAILSKTARGEVAEVVNDTLMSPTYTKSASSILRNLFSLGVEGVQHGSSIGQCSWFDLAYFAAEQVGRSRLVSPIQSEASQKPRRPINSSLETSELSELGILNEEWRESVVNYLIDKGHVL